MAVEPPRIESLAEGEAALRAGSGAPAPTLVVPVRAVVPDWLGALVDRAHVAGATVSVTAEPPADLDGEALDGWEIGVCTAALAVGVDDVIGIDPTRVRRVQAVLDALAAPARQELAT